MTQEADSLSQKDNSEKESEKGKSAEVDDRLKETTEAKVAIEEPAKPKPVVFGTNFGKNEQLAMFSRQHWRDI